MLDEPALIARAEVRVAVMCSTVSPNVPWTAILSLGARGRERDLTFESTLIRNEPELKKARGKARSVIDTWARRMLVTAASQLDRVAAATNAGGSMESLQCGDPYEEHERNDTSRVVPQSPRAVP